MNRHFLKTILLFVVFSVSISNTISQSLPWIELKGTNALEPNNQILTICSDLSGNVYAAGDFVNSSGMRYVAKWDGNSWSELGGINSLSANNTITCITADQSGYIYAAGAFTNANGNQYVAKWRGDYWEEVGGTNSLQAKSPIRSICVDYGNVYVAGSAFNTTQQRVVHWNGLYWLEAGWTNGLSANNNINAVCFGTNNYVYAAGDFTNSNGKRYVAKYVGSNWIEVGGANGLSANEEILSICSDPAGNIYAAGKFTNGADHLSGNNYVAKWNGSSWSELGGNNQNVLEAPKKTIASICSDNNGNIYAAGYFYNSNGKFFVSMWDGTKWSELGGKNTLGANNSINIIHSDSKGVIHTSGNYTNSNNKQYVSKCQRISPIFSQIPAICQGEPNSPLPTSSINGISGTWSPVFNNNQTTTYTFTPSNSYYAKDTSMELTVSPKKNPIFVSLGAVCSGTTVSPLPALSSNNISGNWLPPFNNYITTNYTFTPNSGQCAKDTTILLVVNSIPPSPIGNSIQTFSLNSIVANLKVNGTNVRWYSAPSGGSLLSNSAILINGSSYYASQTVNGCESNERLVVKVKINTSAIDNVIVRKFSYYPNPFEDKLYISNIDKIKSIKIFNNIGQFVVEYVYNESNIEIDMSKLVKGEYILEILSSQSLRSVKVMKH